MEDVMNNNDLRRLNWSYLRKYPKVSCDNCNKVCVWDNKLYDYVHTFKYDICDDCYRKNYNYNFFFS